MKQKFIQMLMLNIIGIIIWAAVMIKQSYSTVIIVVGTIVEIVFLFSLGILIYEYIKRCKSLKRKSIKKKTVNGKYNKPFTEKEVEKTKDILLEKD